MRYKYLVTSLFILIASISLASCGNNVYENSKSYTKYFNTYISVEIYSTDNNTENYFDEIEEIFSYYDELTSKFKSSDNYNNIYDINENPSNTFEIEKELYDLIDFTLTYSNTINNNFNIALDPVIKLWEDSFENIDNEHNGVPPSAADISANLVHTNSNNITLSIIDNKYYISLEENMSLNLGGVAKGYATEEVGKYLDDKDNITGYLITSGSSSIKVGGVNPNKDRDYYTIGLADPIKCKGITYCGFYYEVIKIDGGKSISTSGDYQRYFYHNDVEYSHIIDPSTGYPAVTDIKSVTVIADNSAIADIESTNLFIMGSSDAIEYVNSNDELEAIFYLNNGDVVYSNGMSNLL